MGRFFVFRLFLMKSVIELLISVPCVTPALVGCSKNKIQKDAKFTLRLREILVSLREAKI